MFLEFGHICFSLLLQLTQCFDPQHLEKFGTGRANRSTGGYSGGMYTHPLCCCNAVHLGMSCTALCGDLAPAEKTQHHVAQPIYVGTNHDETLFGLGAGNCDPCLRPPQPLCEL